MRLLSRLFPALMLLLSLQAGAVGPGEPAPAIALATLPQGQSLSLTELRGKVVYVDFWASWCGPCRLSFPQLEAMRAELSPRGFEVLAVNVDEFEADALAFLEEVPVSYPVVRDASGDSPRRYGVRGMPTGYLLARDGTVRLVHQGYRRGDGEHLRAEIVKLLEEP